MFSSGSYKWDDRHKDLIKYTYYVEKYEGKKMQRKYCLGRLLVWDLCIIAYIWRISLVLDPANEKKVMPKIIIIKFCFHAFSTTRLGGSVWEIWDTYITHLFCMFLTPSQWDNRYIHDTINDLLSFSFFFLLVSSTSSTPQTPLKRIYLWMHS